MFEHILSRFRGDADFTTPMPEKDAQHALGALLVRAAKVDKAYLFEEVEQIDAVLMHMYKLNPVEAAKMRARCEKLEEDMPETEALAGILEKAISEADRLAAVAALWSVVFADGVEQQEEDDLLHAVEAVLGISPKVSKQLHDVEMAKRPLKRT